MKRPRRDQKKVEMVLRYRRMKPKPLSFREIARVMASDVKSVYRWYRYGVGSYPQQVT